MNPEFRMEQAIAVTVLALLVIGCFLVLRPFLSALIWAVILAYSTWPVYAWLERHLKGRRSLAAFITTILIAAVLIVPLVSVGSSLADDAARVARFVRQLVQDGPPAPPAWLQDIPYVGPQIAEFWAERAADQTRLLDDVQPYIGSIRDFALASGITLGQGVLELTLSIIAAFFLLRDGRAVGERLERAGQRVAGARAERLIEVAGNTIRGVVYGILGTALVQALLAAIGLWVAGVPGPLFLGVLVFFLSPLPIGPPLVWIPAALWLFYQGDTGWGIFLVVWGTVVVSGVDNVLKPLLISRGGNLPLLLVFLGVLGGAVAFGFMGLFLGPTLLAVGFTLVQEWSASRDASDPSKQG
jgi:predicted PurR-regulated permease PerM